MATPHGQASSISLLAVFVLMLVLNFDTMVVATGNFGDDPEEAVIVRSRIDPAELATIELLECLDDFLVGLAFLYFAYGIYSLFIQLGRKDPTMPRWLRVSSIGSLKKTLLEVLVVLLTVVFVKGLLERLSFRGLEWTYLVIPLSILAIAASTRLLQFEEETPATKKEADE